jgi:large subunit ribosomal protein L31/Ran GTPase-activating protein 1
MLMQLCCCALPSAVAAVLQGLEFLSLQNVGCSVHACKALAELLPQAASLAGLHLFNNMSGDEGAGHVASLLLRCPGMSDFKMASSRVGPAGGISLAKALMAGGVRAVCLVSQCCCL